MLFLRTVEYWSGDGVYADNRPSSRCRRRCRPQTLVLTLGPVPNKWNISFVDSRYVVVPPVWHTRELEVMYLVFTYFIDFATSHSIVKLEKLGGGQWNRYKYSNWQDAWHQSTHLVKSTSKRTEMNFLVSAHHCAPVKFAETIGLLLRK